MSPLLPMMINADHVADNCYILYVADADSQSKWKKKACKNTFGFSCRK